MQKRLLSYPTTALALLLQTRPPTGLTSLCSSSRCIECFATTEPCLRGYTNNNTPSRGDPRKVRMVLMTARSTASIPNQAETYSKTSTEIFNPLLERHTTHRARTWHSRPTVWTGRSILRNAEIRGMHGLCPYLELVSFVEGSLPE